MKKTFIYLFSLSIILSFCAFSQEAKQIQLINADSLIGKEINGEPVRILIGNVQLSQDDIFIKCDRATQFIKSNRAELDGNVVVTQKNIQLNVPNGLYDGQTKYAYGTNGVNLYDGKMHLTAKRGDYNFSQRIAYFNGDVKLYDDASFVKSDYLIYFSDIEKAIATGNVSIVQNSDIIFSDTLVNFRTDRFSIADGNVLIVSSKNKIKIYANHLENYDLEKKTILKGNVLLIQIDTTTSGAIDTLILTCDSIHTYRNENERYFAYDSVKTFRSDFSSRSDFTYFYKTDNKIITFRKSEKSDPPIFWQNGNQIFGDSIIFVTEENVIKQAYIYKDAFLISQDTSNKSKYNQLNGDFIQINFLNKDIENVKVSGKALSIYFAYEDSLANGVNKSSSDSMVISFENKKINQIKLVGDPEGEYYPEELVIGKENDFLLGGFKWFTNRPEKNHILLNRFNLKEKK